jgi:type I restriction enzyme S subunit
MMPDTTPTNDFKDTEIGPIPADWDVVPITDVSKVAGGGTPSTKEPEYWNGDIPFLIPSDVTSHGQLYIEHTSRYITEEGLVNSSAKLMPRGTVLMTSRATIGEAVINTVPMATNQGFINIIIDPDVLLNEFLAYWIRWRKAFIQELGTGTTFLEVAKGVFRTISILLPPLDEQRKVAHVLNTLQAEIAAQDDVIAAMQEAKRSLMARLFTYGPGPEPAPTKETEIGEVPEHWEVAQIGAVIKGTQYGLSQRSNDMGMYPILGMGHMEDGRFISTDLSYVDLDDETFEKFRLHHGDVLFNRTNSFELVGKTAIYDLDGDFVFASYLVRVVTDRDQLLPGYLNYCLNWDTSQQRLKMVATRAVSQSNINATKLRNFEIPFPPLEEQQEIARTVGKADVKLAVERDRKAALQALFQSMLHELMSGHVRVHNTQF